MTTELESTANRRVAAAIAERNAARVEVEQLKRELAKHQEASFHPDWSMLKATRESLREHMKMQRKVLSLLQDMVDDEEVAENGYSMTVGGPDLKPVHKALALLKGKP